MTVHEESSMPASDTAAFDPIALWHAEHVNFATLLDLLEASRPLQPGQAPDYELMLDIMFYMTHYPDALAPSEGRLGVREARRARPRRPAVVQSSASSTALLKLKATRWSSRSTTS
jgi:hypothetical protein